MYGARVKFIHAQALNIGLTFCLKRWGSPTNYCNVRVILLPGAYFDVRHQWPDRPRGWWPVHFDGHHFMKHWRNGMRGLSILGRKFRVRRLEP